MKMKALATAALATTMAVSPIAAEAAEGNPTCVLMKFTDDTRYDAIESAASLSDLVMEKMVSSGRFNLKETRPIDENMEAQLYDEKVREMAGFDAAMSTGDFDQLFEGPGFNEDKAQSIATASVGQIVTPSITSQIGKAHNADYLIQGTIINLGTGNWWNEDYMAMSSAINMVSAMAAAPVASALGGALGPLGGLLGGLDIKRTGIGVQSDMRLIKADTGEVVWSKRVVGIADQKQVSLGLISVGTTKLSANLYAKAMDKAATRIVDSLIADMDAGKLFVK
ncbi:MAG: hypothetical protein IJT01_11210 [Selenomonadaceae bacterium]|nr:hypothetical protein [Selenomonadaceae bacterium]